MTLNNQFLGSSCWRTLLLKPPDFEDVIAMLKRNFDSHGKRHDRCLYDFNDESSAIMLPFLENGSVNDLAFTCIKDRDLVLTCGDYGLLRYLNDVDYYGGFEQEDLDQLFQAIESNYKAWCSGFAPLAVGGDMDSVAVQEFCRTLFNMRPDIALSVAQIIFQSNMRHVLGHVSVPCHIIQSMKDLAVPVAVSEYLHQNLAANQLSRSCQLKVISLS